MRAKTRPRRGEEMERWGERTGRDRDGGRRGERIEEAMRGRGGWGKRGRDGETYCDR